MAADDRAPGVEWSDAEREAVALAAEDALLRMHGVVSSCDGRAEADLILDELAPFVADRERQAAARAWGEGYDAATTMARCWGHTDYWEGEPCNPYEADRIGQEGQP